MELKMIDNNIQEMVQKSLQNDVRARDNDMRLTALIWHKELGVLRDKCMPLLELMAYNKVTNFESISRCRRKLQELHPDLRGDKYKARHDKQQEMKDDLDIMTAERTGINYETNTQLEFGIKQPEKKLNTGDYNGK